MDVHRLDHRFGLGALLGKARAAATCRCSSSTTSSRGKLFLHGLRKTLCRWRALLQFVWRRIARHAALNAPVLAAAFVGLGATPCASTRSVVGDPAIILQELLGSLWCLSAVRPQATKSKDLPSNPGNSAVMLGRGGIT